MKVAADGFSRARGTALGILIGALTIGSAFPHLLASASASVPWRTLMLIASSLARLSAASSSSPWWATDRTWLGARNSILRPSRTHSRNRQTRLVTLGYLGHMWELYAVWTWYRRIRHGCA
jgi:hypothetical protein